MNIKGYRDSGIKATCSDWFDHVPDGFIQETLLGKH